MQRLSVYTEDGTLNIDNNPVEDSIRPVAIGRKNYLFVGSHEAAQRSAMLYSLLGTCKLHGIEPYQWLKSVLDTISDHPDRLSTPTPLPEIINKLNTLHLKGVVRRGDTALSSYHSS